MFILPTLYPLEKNSQIDPKSFSVENVSSVITEILEFKF